MDTYFLNKELTTAWELHMERVFETGSKIDLPIVVEVDGKTHDIVSLRREDNKLVIGIANEPNTTT